jgi:hypothetical protein
VADGAGMPGAGQPVAVIGLACWFPDADPAEAGAGEPASAEAGGLPWVWLWASSPGSSPAGT